MSRYCYKRVVHHYHLLLFRCLSFFVSCHCTFFVIVLYIQITAKHCHSIKLKKNIFFLCHITSILRCNITLHISEIWPFVLSPLFFLFPAVNSYIWWTGTPSWRWWHQCQLHRHPEPRPVCCRPQRRQRSLCFPALPGRQRDRGHAFGPAHQ